AASESRLFWVDSAQDTVCVAGIDGRGPRVLIDLDSALGDVDYSPLDLTLSDSHLF
ncbi:MAG: PEP-CTERM sorting domain-containing protein, partial [Akkermansiaceae bacterium]|nr:PEP-CTERM sorting domain-containing protein [Akkermansiaceae bacterium]